MHTHAIYFSPTYGTEKIVCSVAKTFGEYTTMDLCKPNETYQATFDTDDLCIVGVPAYGGRVPKTAMERLENFKGNQTRVILVVSYGNRAFEDTLKELGDLLQANGFICVGAIAAIAEHNIAHQFAKGRPDQQDQVDVQSFAKQLKEKIESTNGRNAVELPGNFPYKIYKGSTNKPTTDSRCISCGICARLCPVGAIPIEKPYATNHNVCIQCMRCIDVCPEKARALDAVMFEQLYKHLEPLCTSRKENELFI